MATNHLKGEKLDINELGEELGVINRQIQLIVDKYKVQEGVQITVFNGKVIASIDMEKVIHRNSNTFQSSNTTSFHPTNYNEQQTIQNQH